VAAQLVGPSTGAFDDSWDSGQLFWGAAAGGRSPRFERFDLNYDGIYQWGTFGDAPIRAWGIATETG
jgi:hypothetical protein